MAQYDGAIRIVTKITTRDAEESLSSLEHQILKSARHIEELRSKMDALKDQKVPTEEYKALDDYIKQLETSIANLEESLKRLEDVGAQDSDVYRDISSTIEEMNTQLQQARAEMQELVDEGRDFVLGQDTEEYRNIERQIEYEEEVIAEAGRHYRQLLRNQAAYEKLKSIAVNAVKKIGSAVKSGVTLPLKMVRNFIKGSLSTSFKTLGEIAKSSFLKIGQSARKSASGIKTFVLSALVFNQVNAAFNSMISGMKEGFNNLYEESDGFRSAVDELKASVLTLKNALASAFSPIVETAIPYIKRLVEWLTDAADAVGQLLSALMGRRTYTKAVKQTTAAANDAAIATQKEAEATEEAERRQRDI